MALSPWTRMICVILLFVGVCVCVFAGALFDRICYISPHHRGSHLSPGTEAYGTFSSLWRSPPGVPEDSAPTPLPSLRAKPFPAPVRHSFHPSSDAVGNSMGLRATWTWLSAPSYTHCAILGMLHDVTDFDLLIAKNCREDVTRNLNGALDGVPST